jgi:5-methylcytosine-specific restriction endonuclease McrA
MREFARHIYLSPLWRRLRTYILQRDDGLCVRCGKPGNVVHHKRRLTPNNANDPAIAFGEDNLELLCEECHSQEHEAKSAAGEGLMFDAAGNLVRRESHEALYD